MAAKMIDEFKKALIARKHPGMSSRLTLPRLLKQAAPFLTSPSGVARPPLTIYWSVNSVCNLRCKMCDVGNENTDSNFFKNLGINGKSNSIQIERFKGVIDEVAPFKPMISITGTEPMLYKPLGDAISHVRHHDMDIAVTTNGYILAKRAEELVEAGLPQLNVSIDGPSEVHNAIRGRMDSFEKATEGIIRFKDFASKKGKKVKVLVLCTITNINFNVLEQFYNSLSKLPVDQIDFSYMTFINESMAKEHNEKWANKYPVMVTCLNEFTRPEKVNVNELYAQIQAVKSKSDSRVTFLQDFNKEQLEVFFHQPHKFLGSSRCMVSWFIAQIIANGEVTPFTRCFYLPFGNINEQSFMEIWNGDRAKAWRRDLRKFRRFPACTRCVQAY
jgi:MoaA/NifB/PqqE/SkfB family radical SAM enzyme